MATGDLVGQTFGILKPNLNISLDIFVYIFVTIAIGLIVYFRFRGMFYPIKIAMRRRVGGGIIWGEDAGKIVMHEGIRKLYLFGLNKYFPVPSTSDLLPTKGVFRKYCYEVYLNDNNDITPVTFSDNNYKETSSPVKQDLQGWAQMQRKRVENNYGDFMSKYGILIGEGIIAITLIMVAIIIGGKLEKATELLSSALRETATIIQTMRGG